MWDIKKFQLEVTPPGQSVNFLKYSAWKASLFNQDKNYCVNKWSMNAYWKKTGNIPSYSVYEIEHYLNLEGSKELWADIPPYITPVYPVFVEGKVNCEQGKETDATYQFQADDNTSINYYQVSIPLWENKKIRAAYQPSMDTGQFYFPYYKNAKVLVGFEFLIMLLLLTFLYWESGVALPMDSQGNQNSHG